MKDARRYYAEGIWVYDRLNGKPWIAQALSVRLAKRIANLLNMYVPKVRRVKRSAEKEVNPRP